MKKKIQNENKKKADITKKTKKSIHKMYIKCTYAMRT